MQKLCRDCGIGLEERTLQRGKCARAQLQTSCCNCRADKGKCFLKCAWCNERCAVFDSDAANAVVMASHSRLGAVSPLRALLLQLEPQLIRLIVQGGAMRGATASRAPLGCAEAAEVCVSFLQLGRCQNGENCRFAHAVAKVKGGGQLPPGYVLEQDELKFVGPSGLPVRIPPLSPRAALSPFASTWSKIRTRAGVWSVRPLGWNAGEKEARRGDLSDNELEVEEYGAETRFCFRARQN